MIESGDVIRIVIQWLLDNETVVQNVFHYLFSSGSDQDPDDVLAAIVTDLDTSWAANMEDHVSDNLEGDTAELLVFNSATGFFDGLSTQTHTMDGANIGDWMAPGVALLLKFFTSIGRFQGRKYIAAINEGGLTNGDFTSALATDGALLAADWDDDVTVNGAVFKAGVFNTAAERFTQFSDSVAAATNPSYQRRRRTGVGI